ncbi:two pore potassium channel protein sup-9-like [Oculina patagonica]
MPSEVQRTRKSVTSSASVLLIMDPLIKTALLRTLVFFLMTILSAWLFVQVEYTGEDNSKEKYQLLHSLYKSMASKYNMTIEEFNNFSSVAHKALSEPKPQWTFFVAYEFVISAVTTIGYGYITPQTSAGHVLYIVVSLFGIPITLLTLKSMGELVARRANRIVTKFEKRILGRAEPKQVKTKSAVILVASMVVLMTASGFVILYLEDWTFIEAVYFWFITFSTIGFGDYVISVSKLSFNTSVNQESKDKSDDIGEYTYPIIYSILTTLNCLYGLCIVSSVLNSIMASLEEGKRCIQCPGCFRRTVQDHANSEENNTPEQREMDGTCFTRRHLQT